MIAKITRGARPGEIAAYLHGPGRANEHRYRGGDGQVRVGGRVIGGNLGREGAVTGSGWAADLRAAIASRDRAAKDPVWQVSLRAAPGDRCLSDAEWGEAGQVFAERMGFDGHPWVLVRHADDHVHLVMSRVDEQGRLWSRSHDYRRAQQARAELEHRYGLQQAPLRSTAATRHDPTHRVTQGEYRRAERTGKAPQRVLLAGRVREAADAAQGQGRTGFETALTAAGVAYRANITSTGRVHGYSFHLPGHRNTAGQNRWWSGSKLDRALSWPALRESLDTPRALPAVAVPKKLLETKKHHAGRIHTARQTAANQQAAHRLGQVPDQVKRRALDTARWWTNHAVQTHAATAKRAAEQEQQAHVKRILAAHTAARQTTRQTRNTTNDLDHDVRPYIPAHHHNQDRGQGFSR